MITVTDDDRAATLARALSRANRAGDALDADPPTPPEPTFARAQRQPDPRGAVPDVPEWVRPPTYTRPETGEVVDITTPEHVLQTLANHIEDERVASWREADVCAYLWAQTGSTAERRAVLGKMAEYLNATTRTARRRIALGMTFPPELRALDKSQALYLTALKAESPVEAIMAALAFGWSERQLAEHILGNENPVERLSLLDDEIAAADLNPAQIAELVASLIADAPDRSAGRLLRVRVRVDAEYEGIAA